MNISDYIGFIGTFFLVVRLTPILFEQFTDPQEINAYFIMCEFLACVFLGTSAILINSLPFILANTLNMLNLLVIIFIQIKLRRNVTENTEEFSNTSIGQEE